MLLLYFGVKFLVFSLWCYVYLYFQMSHRNRYAKAFFFGFVRLLIGLLLSVPFFYIGLTYQAPIVLIFYLPMEWVAWALIEIVMNSNARSLHAFLLGVNNRLRLWRIGGIIISFLLIFLLAEVLRTMAVWPGL